mgnify:FL=1
MVRCIYGRLSGRRYAQWHALSNLPKHSRPHLGFHTVQAQKISPRVSLGLGHWPCKFSGRYLEKKFGKKNSPRGAWPPKFFRGDYSSSRAIRLKNLVSIAWKLWPVDACENSKNVILAPLRLCPGAQGGPTPKIFFAYFFLGLGHDSGKFSDRYLEKKFGEKFSPRGVRPPKFLEGDCIPPRVMCLQSFIAIALKLWPVDVGKTRGGQNK